MAALGQGRTDDILRLSGMHPSEDAKRIGEADLIAEMAKEIEESGPSNAEMHLKHPTKKTKFNKGYDTRVHPYCGVKHIVARWHSTG